ncbi:MAG: hypothetical protein ACREM6_10230 [Vulcanimicrobiaceae bacterium]
MQQLFRVRGIVGSITASALVALSFPALAAMMAPPSISVVSPAAGATVSGANIPVTVGVHNFALECANMGKTNAPMGEGHIHLMVDGMDLPHLIAPFCSTKMTIPGQGLAAGKHMLTVVLATDAHAMASMPVSVPFTYEPQNVVQLPTPISGAPAPSVSVLSPQNGAAVSPKFDLVVAVKNFRLSCDLEGKKDVAGYGHIHVFVEQNGETSAAPGTPMLAMMQTPDGMKMGQMLAHETGMTTDQLKPMMQMAMPGMVGMPCTENIPVDLSSWNAGPAKIIVQLANDDHMPTMGVVPATLSVEVKH